MRTKRFKPRTLAAAAMAGTVMALLVSCASVVGSPLEVSRGTVLRNVTVVGTRDGSLKAGMALVIDGGRIQRIVADSSVRVVAGANTVDGSGQYVVPGYLDLHTHAMTAADQQPTHWPLLLAHGITGIREMAGSAALIQRVKQLNADSAAGRIDAPEVLQVPGDLVVGAPSAAAAAQIVRQQKEAGASFVKVVAASREATLALLTEAKVQGMDVAGHLPIAVKSAEAAAGGWRSIEHFGSGFGVLLDCAGEEVAVRAAILRGEGAKPSLNPTSIMSPMLLRADDAPFYQRVLDSYDPVKCEAAAKAMVVGGTWQVPTLIRLRTMMYSDDALYRQNPNLEYVDKTRRALWEQLGSQYAATVPAPAAATFRAYYEQITKLVPLMKKQGAKLLAGSDLGGIWVSPGVALHQEFRELSKAGLSPLEILQATTINGAQFLRREATMGTVEVGKEADLVMLEANPLADVANLSRISGVFLNGKYFPKSTLERMKREVAEAYRTQPLKNVSAAIDPNHRH